MYLDQYDDNFKIERSRIPWWKSRKFSLRQISQCHFQLVVAPTETTGLYGQWNSLQRKPPWSCEYFVKPAPLVSPAVIWIYLNRDSDGDSFDDIFSAHFLECGRNTEQGIDINDINFDIHDDVLQSLHRWPEHIGETEPGIRWVPDYNGARN